MSRITLLIIGSLTLASAPASAQTTNDVQCLLASNVFSKSGTDEKAKKLAEAAMYFYLGRISGRFTDAQLKSALVGQQKVIKGENVGAIMTACAKNVRGSAIKLQNLTRPLESKK